MLGSQITLKGVKGVGTVCIEQYPAQKIYTLIGTNGAGKTKTLESLFQSLIATHKDFFKVCGGNAISWILREAISDDKMLFKANTHPSSVKKIRKEEPNLHTHNIPIVFLGTQNRGFINPNKKPIKNIGAFESRRATYFKSLLSGMSNNFSGLNMDIGIEEWFLELAHSSNPYQAREDNREIELKTTLKLINIIEPRIDSVFMELTGDGHVKLKVDGEKRELSHLSTGFASILKIIQAIVSGYGYFTNETLLQNVKGIVLIDEIESHLHISWQANIIPLLKRLFPNTTFYITTHSSIVLSQLEEGEAYRLERGEDGIVRTHLIKSPNKAAMVDVLKDAFGIDLNQMKLERMSAEQQQDAKHRLLSLINQ
jgi:predicted ATP-binding protein involved in virulence